MNIELTQKVGGKINWLRVIGKDGKVKHDLGSFPNIILNSGIRTDAGLDLTISLFYTQTSNAESYEDLDGTWDQTGNTITRATGTGTFPSSPSQIGNELKFSTGERCHVLTRVSDTQITVSGPSRTITGGTLRRFIVNGFGVSSTSGAVQSTSTITTTSDVYNDTASTRTTTFQVNFASATSAYSLGSILSSLCRVKLPSPVSIEIDDQIQFSYTVTQTISGRSQIYELGSESTGIPQKHSMLTISGSGTAVDVTFSAATHFLAGDKLDLRSVIPKQFAISSASSTVTTFTINTSSAHGLSVGNSVVISGASVSAYNGTFTVATVPTSTSFTITNAANPGAMGASGYVRLATPGTYFNSLGLATIASMVSSSVARITSAITGPAVEPAQIGGDPGITVKFVRRSSTATYLLALSNTATYAYNEANAKAVVDDTTFGFPAVTGSMFTFDSVSTTNASTSTDWKQTTQLTRNSGTGTAATRIKQILSAGTTTGTSFVQITFNTPFDKSTSQRLRFTVTRQILRDLP
jgi:hypothetical protein